MNRRNLTHDLHIKTVQELDTDIVSISESNQNRAPTDWYKDQKGDTAENKMMVS